MYKIQSNLKKVQEQLKITDLDVILLELWYETQIEIKPISLEEDTLINIVNTQAKAKVYRELAKVASKRVWEKGSIILLKSIIDQVKFNIGFMVDQQEVLPKEILPRLSSWDEIKSSDPRANIAKQLGAKIIA